MASAATDLLKRYVALHNHGVRTGDFTQLVSLFAPSAVMRFENAAFGPLDGASEIADAFSTHPPDDELELLSVAPTGQRATYAWATQRRVAAGELRLRDRDGLIIELVVASSDSRESSSVSR